MIHVALPLTPPTLMDIRSQGAGQVSAILEKIRQNTLKHMQKSSSLYPRLFEAFTELDEVTEECTASGWDGYNAIPISQSTIALGRRFLKSLPLGTAAPTVCGEPDGHISFEWFHSPHRILSVSMAPEANLHYASLLGASKSYGSEPFYEAIPEPIMNLVSKVLV